MRHKMFRASRHGVVCVVSQRMFSLFYCFCPEVRSSSLHRDLLTIDDPRVCRTVPPSRAVAEGRSSRGWPIRARSVRRPSAVVGAEGSAWADQANLLFSEFVGGRMRVGIRRGGDLVKAVRNAPPTVE